MEGVWRVYEGGVKTRREERRVSATVEESSMYATV
jgi:hypothetical protein